MDVADDGCVVSVVGAAAVVGADVVVVETGAILPTCFVLPLGELGFKMREVVSE